MAKTRERTGRVGPSGRPVDVLPSGRAVLPGTKQAIGFRPGEKGTVDPTTGIRVPPQIGQPGQAGVPSQLGAAPPGQQPQQPTQQAETGIWNWIKDKYYTAIGQGFDPREEAKITGEPMQGASMMSLLGLGAAASTMAAFGGGSLALSPGAPKIGLHVTKTSAKVFRETGRIITNPKNWSLVSKIIVGAGILSATAVTAIGSIVFGKFQINEGIDKLNFAAWEARKKGATEIAIEMETAADELIAFSQTKTANTPLIGAALGTIENTKAAFIANNTYKAIREIEEEAKATGTDEHTLYLQKKEETEKRITDYYNQQRLITNAAIQLAERKHNEDERLAWEAYAEAQRKLEEEERKRIAEFWLEYIKQKQKLLESYGRSQLSFGLLR